MNGLLWILTVTAFLIWYLLYHWNRRRLYRLSAKVPGPKGWPFVGSIFELVGDHDVIFNTIMNFGTLYPNIYKIWLGPVLVYGISKPEYLEKVLTSPKALSKMEFYKFTAPSVGNGLFTAPVPVWKRHRKIIMPTFNQRILDNFVEVFGKHSAGMCDELENYVGVENFDVFPVISTYIIQTLCDTVMNMRIPVPIELLIRGIDRSMEIIFSRIVNVWYYPDLIFKRTKLYEEQSQYAKLLDEFIESVIKDRQMSFEQNSVSTKRKVFLDLLIEMFANRDSRLTLQEIKDEVKTIVIGGLDTTSNTIGLIFTMLGMHPEIQEKVHAEVTSVLNAERIAEPQDLSPLVYTERVIKETMRLFPAGPFILRAIDDDLSLEDDLILPKGCSVALCIMHVHRNSKYWPHPLRFDPDRFLPEEVAKRHSFAYLPFSGGPRNCIGMKYAMMNMKTIVANVIRRFKIRTSYKRVEDVKVLQTVILRPRDGFGISLELREKKDSSAL